MTRRRDRTDYLKAYRAVHRAERAAYNAANREAILAYSRARYALKGADDNARARARKLAYPELTRAQNKAKYYSVPPDVRQARTKAYNAKYADAKRAWREKNKHQIAIRAAAFARNNPALKQAAAAKRKATKLRATPAWADLSAVQAIYQESTRLTRDTGVKHEVDHIVPLTSPVVCGLHCEANLRIVTRTENRRKLNKLLAA